MKQILFITCMATVMASCGNPGNPGKTEKHAQSRDTLIYPYKATYSQDATVPSHPEYVQKVLTVWKLYESNKISAMKQYYADTVTYESSGGFYFHGNSADLLKLAAKGSEGLDSLRFDISNWQSVHLNDKNEDWVYIWAVERRYDKKGADTSLIHEQWKIEKGKVVYFNQYSAKPAKKH